MLENKMKLELVAKAQKLIDDLCEKEIKDYSEIRK